jgi:hypothetical protein
MGKLIDNSLSRLIMRVENSRLFYIDKMYYMV